MDLGSSNINYAWEVFATFETYYQYGGSGVKAQYATGNQSYTSFNTTHSIHQSQYNNTTWTNSNGQSTEAMIVNANVPNTATNTQAPLFFHMIFHQDVRNGTTNYRRPMVMFRSTVAQDPNLYLTTHMPQCPTSDPIRYIRFKAGSGNIRGNFRLFRIKLKL